MSYSYWEIFYNPDIPTAERLAVLAATPLIPLAILGGCAEVEPDREKTLEKVLPDAEDAIDLAEDIEENKDAFVCVPEECDGLIDKSRADEDKYLCISFQEIAADTGLASKAEHTALELVDINGDGRDDLYLLNNGAPNQLFINNNGVFSEEGEKYGLNIGGDSRSAAFGDYNNNGNLNMLLAGDSGSYLYASINGVFTKDYDGAKITDSDPGLAALWLGSNLFLATENGTRFYRFTGGGFVEDAAGSGLYDPGSGAAFAVGDYNADGLNDIYLANLTGKNRFFVDLGDGMYQSSEDELNVKGEYGQSTDAQWVTLQPTDTTPSLYVSNWDAANLLYIKTGEKFEDKAKDLGLQDPGNTTCAKWGDFLNEGFPGLFLCRYGQMNLLYLPELEGDAEEKKVIFYTNIAYPSKMAIEGETVDASWLDYDKDGLLDLVVVMADGAIYLYHNETHWVSGCSPDL